MGELGTYMSFSQECSHRIFFFLRPAGTGIIGLYPGYVHPFRVRTGRSRWIEDLLPADTALRLKSGAHPMP